MKRHNEFRNRKALQVNEDRALLIVDDEEHILNSLKRLLRREPYRVHAASSGAEGLEVLAGHDVQMVMSDQRMPHMTGTEFLQKVKECWPDTVRVVLSGYAEADVIVESINQGEVYRFIAKPWNDEGLKLTIRQCFEHYEMTQENRTLQEQTEQQVTELERLNRLLQGSVMSRTRSLQFSQEVLEALPAMVLGISREKEIVLTNSRAQERFAAGSALMPGTDMDDVLPQDVADAVRSCLDANGDSDFRTSWDAERLRVRTALLGSAEERRGCVLLLEEDGDGDEDG